jgi:DNA polymerase-3 subunit delta'
MFDHLIGNQTVKDTIRRFISTGRVPNSLLFAGPEGVGKKQFALQLARSIICRDRHNGEPCGRCTACGRVNEFKLPGQDAKGEDYDRVFFSAHSDVGMVVPFNRTLRVGSIRALETEANFRPYEAVARVFIISDAEKMKDAAANALLKTLEEPPPTSHIFLITSKPNALLPTIRSRVQNLRFGPVDAKDIEHLLLTSHKFSLEEAELISTSVNGSVGRAVSVDVEEFRSLKSDALEILKTAIFHKDVVAILRRSEKVAAQISVPEYESFLDMLQMLIHQIWSIKMRRPNFTSPPEFAELSAASDPVQLASWLKQIEKIKETLAVNINKKIATDDLLVKMVAK